MGAIPLHPGTGVTMIDFRKLFERKPKFEATLEGRIESGITLDYTEEKWGIHRIVLDGIQNHRPADAEGTRVDVEFMVDDRWISYYKREKGDHIQAIRFTDDGKNGYSSKLLGVLYSKKRNNPAAAGHFGEGIKMISAAAIREGIDLELRSRDWSARPTTVDIDIDNTPIKKLAFDVSASPLIKGSQTIFWNPPEKLLESVLDLERTFIPMRKNHKPIYQCERSAIHDEAGDIFVKDLFVTNTFKDRLLFTYELDLIPNRDRDNLHENQLVGELQKIWGSVRVTKPIKRLLAREQDDVNGFAASHELYALLNTDNLDQTTWQTAFQERYGPKAVMQTQKNLGLLAERLGYKPVVIQNGRFMKLLEKLGIQKDISILDKGDDLLYCDETFDPSEIRKDVKIGPSVLDYRTERWGPLRIVLDSIANHMPEDSGGTEVAIDYLVEETNEKNQKSRVWGKKLFYGATPKAVRISDNGRGYSLEHLLFMGSTKDERAVGQFGEGIKLLAAACVREKVPIKFRSRDWFAMPIAQPVSLDDKVTERLGYKTIEGAAPMQGSSTTLYDPTSTMRDIFDNIGYYVLDFNKNLRVLHETSQGRLIAPEKNPTLYVKRFFVATNDKMIFSYDLPTRDIAPDRHAVDQESLQKRIKTILETCPNIDVPIAILKKARDEKKEYAEFIELDFHDREVKEAWANAFKIVFGENAVLDGQNPACNYDAEHRGKRIVYLPPALRRNLQKARVIDTQWLAFFGFQVIEEEEIVLTAREQRTMDLFAKVDGVLGIREPSAIKIYGKVRDYEGKEEEIKGFYTQHNKTIHLKRSVLSDPPDAVRVYTHERGHNITGAPDPADQFRHFFEGHLLPFVLATLDTPNTQSPYDPLPFDYERGIKEQERLAALYREKTAAAETIAETIEKDFDARYGKKINDLRDENVRLKNELSTAQRKPWYARLFGRK